MLVVGKKVLNGTYIVYYDKDKTKLLGSIGFTNGKIDKKVERYRTNGTKFYSAVISNEKLNGVLSLYEDNIEFIHNNYSYNTFVNSMINCENDYEYDITNDSLELNVTHGNNEVIYGLFNTSKEPIEINKYVNGVEHTSLKFTNGILDGISKETIDLVKSFNYDFDEGVPNEPLNIIGSLYDRDMKIDINVNKTTISIVK